jgi:prevent-host-death family protein
METLSASDAKREFGEVLIKAQQGPVGINKNGKPVAVMVSAKTYAEIERMTEKFLQIAIDHGLDDVKAGRVSEGADTVQRLRKMVTDAEL